MNNSRKLHTSPVDDLVYNPKINNPHKFTLKTQREYEKIISKVAVLQKSKTLPANYLQAIQSIYRGRLVCRQESCFHITVSEKLIYRALRFLDDIAKELEKLNFKIRNFKTREKNFVAACKDDEYICFQITEGYKYQPVNNELRTEYEKLLYRDKSPFPTGKLTFSMTAHETGISKRWSDGANTIENFLPLIIDSFNTIIIKQKERRILNTMEAERHRESCKVFNEIESKRQIEKSIYDNAMAESLRFIEYQNLKAYLSYIESEYIRKFGSLNDAALDWLAAARKVSELKNPSTKRLIQLKNL